MSYFKQIVRGLAGLFVGMGITLRNLFRKPVTLEYPHQKPELSKAYRSAIALIRFPETNTHDCVACMQCVQICPSYCITIEGAKLEGQKRKRATEFKVDYSLCSVCGLCLDVCPTTTLEYSKLYDVAGYRRDEFVYDLLEPFVEQEKDFLDKARAAQNKPAQDPPRS